MNKLRFKLLLLKNKFIFEDNYIYKLLFQILLCFLPFLFYINPLLFEIITKDFKIKLLVYLILSITFTLKVIKIPKIKNFDTLKQQYVFNFIVIVGFMIIFNKMYNSSLYEIFIHFIVSQITLNIIFFIKLYEFKTWIIYLFFCLEILVTVIFFIGLNFTKVIYILITVTLIILCIKLSNIVLKKIVNNPFILETKIHYLTIIGVILLFIPYTFLDSSIHKMMNSWPSLKLIKNILKSSSIIYIIYTLAYSEHLVSIDLNYIKRFETLHKNFIIKNQIFWIIIFNIISMMFYSINKINLYYIVYLNVFILSSIKLNYLFKFNKNQTVGIVVLIFVILSFLHIF